LIQLQRENDRLAKRLQQAELIIDVQKKLSQMLGITLENSPEMESP
jgi:transposase